MYVPRHFALGPEAARDIVASRAAGDLVTFSEAGLEATFLPFLFDPDVGGHGVLHAHLARDNEQWQRGQLQDAMVIVRGTDAYISPSWYEAKQRHGRVVPTWNYVTVHLRGKLTTIDDRTWLATHVRRLTDRHERGEQQPWSVADAPPAFLAARLEHIVGLELEVTDIQAKAKMSQNRPGSDIKGIVDSLRDREDHATAAAVVAAHAGCVSPGSVPPPRDR